MIDYVPHAQHAAITVTDYDGIRKASLRHPARRNGVVLYAFARELKSPAFRVPAVACAEHIMPTPVEREEGKAEARQRGRQKARRADVEIHCVTVKIKHTARGRAAIRL